MPRNNSVVALTSDGQYFHFGIVKGLKDLIDAGNIPLEDNHLLLQINVDGVPLFKSNNMALGQFYVLLNNRLLLTLLLLVYILVLPNQAIYLNI